MAIPAWAMAWSGCATSVVAPLPPIPPKAPDYVRVPHPDGLDIADLKAIFVNPEAPLRESLKDCDAAVLKLRNVTQNQDEVTEGTRELVRMDPVKFHWCFYGKLLDLEDHLQKDLYFDERQKHVLGTYASVTPMARAFLAEYRDTRYLRWAITRYRRISEYVFFRKVELTPELTQDLSGASNPFGLLRPPKNPEGGVLERYGLAPAQEMVTAPEARAPAANPQASPLPVTSPLPEPSKPPEPSPLPVTSPLPQSGAEPESAQSPTPGPSAAAPGPAPEPTPQAAPSP